ncbi:hypothetical protein VTJ49DRAFT_646 [Mycothermus thermophilus]|uniref:BHLH domain-containing protein n=1 Tax=Humicola insolens TaxID=85995 RepID=A0ABR3VEZ5_HUMIN
MREEARIRQRGLHILDLCNGDTAQEPPPPGPEDTKSSRKRHHGATEGTDHEPEAERSGKRKRPAASAGHQTSPRSSKPASNTTKMEETKKESPYNPSYSDEEDAEEEVPASKRKQQNQNHRQRKPTTDQDKDKDIKHHSRKRHNLVEQQYRLRLNSQFKRLLDILPPSPEDGLTTTTAGGDISQTGSGTRLPGSLPSPQGPPPLPQPGQDSTTTKHGPSLSPTDNAPTRPETENQDDHNSSLLPRRISKGEVLDRARRYIQLLEREHRRLVAERRELELMWAEAEAGGQGPTRFSLCFDS